MYHHYIMIWRPTISTLFPYTTLFRSLEVARANALQHGVEKNIRFLQGDLLQALPNSLRADVIVSNPPYIRSEEHTSELQSHSDLVCRLLLEKKNGLKLWFILRLIIDR